GVAGRHDARDAGLPGLFDLAGEQVGRLRAAQAQVHHVDLVGDAVVDGLDEVAEPPTREDLARVQFGLRHDADDAGAVVRTADDARAVRAVPDRVDLPAGVVLPGDVPPGGHPPGEVGVFEGGAGVH